MLILLHVRWLRKDIAGYSISLQAHVGQYSKLQNEESN